MTKARCIHAAALRGIWFDGEKKWLNSLVGYGYQCWSPNGTQLFQSNTLAGIYRFIMEFEKL